MGAPPVHFVLRLPPSVTILCLDFSCLHDLHFSSAIRAILSPLSLSRKPKFSHYQRSRAESRGVVEGSHAACSDGCPARNSSNIAGLLSFFKFAPSLPAGYRQHHFPYSVTSSSTATAKYLCDTPSLNCTTCCFFRASLPR